MKRLIAPLTAIVGLCSLAFGVSGALAAVPTIPLRTVSAVTTESALLEAEINPKGKATEYHFEYGLGDCSTEPSPCTSTQTGALGKGESPVRVKASVKGLSPATTYHFRVVAKNGDGKAESTDRTFATYLRPQDFGACPNEGLRNSNPAAARIEYSSANLPDCRAFEQATPVDKNGGDVTGTVPFVRAALNGDGIVYLSVSGVPGGKGSQELPSYLASRGEGGWSTQGLLPPAIFGQRANVLGWTADFEDIYTEASKLADPSPTTAFLESPGPGAEPRAVGEYVTQLRPRFAGASADGALVLFESHSAMPSVPGSVQGKSNLYLWDRESQQLSLAGVLNEGQAPPGGTFAGPYDWVRGTSPKTLSEGGADRDYYTQEEWAIAANGAAVYFTAAGSGQLYARLNPTQSQSKLDGEGKCTEPALACTVQVNASKKEDGSGPNGTDPAGARPAAFMAASVDGSKSFFTSSEMLTNDANTGPEQEPATIERADIDGANLNPSCVPIHATGVAVDSAHIYWANSGTATIGRANLECGEVDESFISTGPGSPQYVAVDGAHIYWTNDAEGEEAGIYPPGEGGTIGRADIDGEAASVEAGFITGLGAPQGIAVNATYIYWANAPYAGGSIGRAGVDGSGVEVKFYAPRPEDPRGVALDASHLYWSTHAGSSDFGLLHRAELDGSNEVIFNIGEKIGMRGIAVDGKYVYWASQGEKAIGRIDLNLSEGSVQRGFIKAAGAPDGVAVDANHIYWAVNGNSPPNPGNDLYGYDAQAKTLRDLAPDSSAENGTEVLGVLGASRDGSYLYFAANGVPDGVTNSPNGRGESAEAGSCPYGIEGSVPNRCNLYLAHAGGVEFIAGLESGRGESETDAANWAATPSGTFPNVNFQKTSRVSDDGRALLFRSQRRLSGYENDGTAEFYRFEVGGQVQCVSCNPTGMAPSAVGQASFGKVTPSTLFPNRPASVLGNNFSGDGKRVFFETTDALVGTDTNGEAGCPLAGSLLQQFRACSDVYEWEAAGTGSCVPARAVADGGCIYLLSTGKGTEPALIADASGDGKDVFFFSRSRLVGQDEDDLLDVYDARIDGGLGIQNQPPPIHCEGEACKPAPSAPPPVPSPPKFSGPGNPKPGCAKGKHKVKGRCVAKKHHKAKKKHKRGKGKAQAKGGK